MTTPGTTTIRVRLETRDQLNDLIAEDFPGKTVDDVIGRLIAEHWKAGSLADVERYRRDNPAGFANYLRDSGLMDTASAADLEGVA